MAYFSRKNRFNRYFAGYEQRTEYDSKGNEKTKFVYVGNYFEPDITEAAFKWRKVINLLMLAVSFALQIAAGIFASIPMNSTKQMAVAQCLSIVGIIATGIFVISHATSPYHMEQHAQNNAHDKLTIVSLVSWLVMLAAFLCAVVSAILAASDFFFGYILWLLAYLASAGCIFVIWFLEKRTEYTILPPDHY